MEIIAFLIFLAFICLLIFFFGGSKDASRYLKYEEELLLAREEVHRIAYNLELLLPDDGRFSDDLTDEQVEIRKAVNKLYVIDDSIWLVLHS